MILPYSVLTDFRLQFDARYCKMTNIWNEAHHNLRLLTDATIRIRQTTVVEPFGEAEVEIESNRAIDNNVINFVGNYRNKQDIPVMVKGTTMNVRDPFVTPLKYDKDSGICLAVKTEDSESQELKEHTNRLHMRKNEDLEPLEMKRFPMKDLTENERRAAEAVIEEFHQVFARNDLDGITFK